MVFSNEISDDRLVNWEGNQDKFQRRETHSESLNYCARSKTYALPHHKYTLIEENAKTVNDQEVKDQILKDYQNDELVNQNNFISLIYFFVSSQEKKMLQKSLCPGLLIYKQKQSIGILFGI